MVSKPQDIEMSRTRESRLEPMRCSVAGGVLIGFEILVYRSFRGELDEKKRDREKANGIQIQQL